MIEFIKRCENWLYKNQLHWSFFAGFLITFILGFLFLSCLAILGYILHKNGISNLPALFFETKLFPIAFVTSIMFFIGIILTIPKLNKMFANFERDYYAFAYYKRLKRKESLVKRYKDIDKSIRNFTFLVCSFFSRPSTIISVSVILITLLVFYWKDIHAWLGLSIDNNPIEKNAQFFRNRGFALAAFIGIFVTSIGMGLTIWGRVLTQKQTRQNQEKLELDRETNQHARYEKAARMLSSDVLAVRIAGCHALRSLGIEDLRNFDIKKLGETEEEEEDEEEEEKEIESKSMATECVDLLLAYICNPPFATEGRKAIEDNTNFHLLETEKKLNLLFPENKALRGDIQAASDSVSSLYKHCVNNDIEVDALKFSKVILPSYFWKNTKKNDIFLRGAIIQGDLQDAYLVNADLINVNLATVNMKGANLQNAKMHYADLSGADMRKADLGDTKMKYADLSGADMRWTENLIEEQVREARWYNHKVNNMQTPNPPQLPKYLENDFKIVVWLEDPDSLIEDCI